MVRNFEYGKWLHERSRKVNEDMDKWIAARKADGTWKDLAPTAGQNYYTELVVAAMCDAMAQQRKLDIALANEIAQRPDCVNGLVATWVARAIELGGQRHGLVAAFSSNVIAERGLTPKEMAPFEKELEDNTEGKTEPTKKNCPHECDDDVHTDSEGLCCSCKKCRKRLQLVNCRACSDPSTGVPVQHMPPECLMKTSKGGGSKSKSSIGTIEREKMSDKIIKRLLVLTVFVFGMVVGQLFMIYHQLSTGHVYGKLLSTCSPIVSEK